MSGPFLSSYCISGIDIFDPRVRSFARLKRSPKRKRTCYPSHERDGFPTLQSAPLFVVDSYSHMSGSLNEECTIELTKHLPISQVMEAQNQDSEVIAPVAIISTYIQSTIPSDLADYKSHLNLCKPCLHRLPNLMLCLRNRLLQHQRASQRTLSIPQTRMDWLGLLQPFAWSLQRV
jgi:hypothetical protein